MIIMCLAFLLVGAIAAALISYLPFIVSILSLVAIGAVGTFFLDITMAQFAVVAMVGLCLAQVGYAAGLGMMAVLYGTSTHFIKGKSTKAQRSWLMVKLLRK